MESSKKERRETKEIPEITFRGDYVTPSLPIAIHPIHAILRLRAYFAYAECALHPIYRNTKYKRRAHEERARLQDARRRGREQEKKSAGSGGG